MISAFPPFSGYQLLLIKTGRWLQRLTICKEDSARAASSPFLLLGTTQWVGQDELSRQLGYEGHANHAKDFESFSVMEGKYSEDYSRGGGEANVSFSNLPGGPREEDGGWAWIWDLVAGVECFPLPSQLCV